MIKLNFFKQESIYNDYINGNLSQFYKEIDKMNRLQLVDFIVLYAEDTRMIERILTHFENK